MFILLIRPPPRSARLTHSFPPRRSSDLSRKKIVLLIDETLFVIGKLGHIIPFEKWGEPKPAPAGSRNRALTCPEEITVSNGSPLGEIPGAAASGGFEGGTARNLGGRGEVTACMDHDIFAPVAATPLRAKPTHAHHAMARTAP